MQKRMVILAFLLIFLSSNSLGATLSGTVYDMNLDVLKNSVLSVSTKPVQTFVSKDGSYSFFLPNGNYTIDAIYRGESGVLSMRQNVSITDNGNFTMDAILFPDLSEEKSIFDENLDIPSVNYVVTPRKNSFPFLAIIIPLIFLILVGFYFSYKRIKSGKKEELVISEEDLADQVLKFINDEGGRVTQKDIRGKFPYSEAKISLVVSELESKSLVKRIKKGRTNIIVAEKK